MKEVNFKDRVPTKPGRVTLTPVVGASNTYDLIRADEPTEDGTPLDKATFNSIIHSRLTGRYYTPTVTHEVNSGQTGLSASPIPTSGWIYDTDNTDRATNGVYVVETSSNNGSAWLADGAFRSAGWQNMGGDSAWITISHKEALKVRKIQFTIEMQYNARLSSMEIQGSNNGTTWNTLRTMTSVDVGVLTDYTIDTPADYKYYRLYFTMTDSNRVTVKNLKYSLYDVNTYKNVYKVAEGLPASWTAEQRLMIATPSTVNTFGVMNNTLNGVTVNTILQQGKRYELRYNGSAFVAKEV